MQWKFVAFQIVFLYTACVYSNQPVPDFGQMNLNDLKSILPPGLIPTEFSNANVTVDDLKQIIRDKCMTVSKNSSVYNELDIAAQKLSQCITTNFDVSELPAEIAKASPSGGLDVVFAQYCEKRGFLTGCLRDFKSVADKCLEPYEIQLTNTALTIFKSLLEFACYKGGNQIALFYAEKGDQCFNNSAPALFNCLHTTYTKYTKNSPTLPSVESMAEFKITPEDCKNVDEFEVCVLKELETCENITPANIVESMFKYVRNETHCPERSFSPNHTPHWISLLFIIGMAFITRALTF